MSACTRVRAALERCFLERCELSEDDRSHAQKCAACARELGSNRAYTELVSRAREALTEERVMSPEAWAQLRTDAEKREKRAVLEWMLQPALALAMAAMVFWIAMGQVETTSPLDGRLVEARPTPPAHSAIPSGEPSLERPRELGPGSVIASQARAREVNVFGRHTLELDPRTRVTVVAWNPRRIVVNVTSGSVRAVVRRELKGDHFEVRTPHARARALGTDYRVSVRQQGVTTVRVDHGVVEVTDAASQVTRVEAGALLRVGRSGRLQERPERPPESVAAEPEAPDASKKAPTRSRSKPSKGTRGQARPTNPIKTPASHPRGLKVIEIDIAPQSAEPPGGG